ncbi:MAG: lysyl oxidase family protein [Thermoleophilaceae bacterium]
MTPGRASLALAAAGSLVAAVLAVGAGAQTPTEPEDPNPCLGEEAAELLCPDLRMARPSDIRIDRRTRRGRRLLRMRNSIDSVGLGPASLRGRRDGRKTMHAYQVIERARGGRKLVRTGARLYWQPVPGQGRYWKFADAARFELWKLDRGMRKQKLVRTGPKQNYCLRDLERTRRSRRSPRRRVYPACSQDRDKRAVTLGTSVGWSDIYPASYHQNWIDVTGVPRGRYLVVQGADPKNGIWELDEDNNQAEVVVWLPSGKVMEERSERRRRRDPDPYR